MADIFADDGVRSHVTSQTRKRLGKGAHDYVDLLRQAEVFRSALSVPSQHSQPVRVVHHDARAVFFCKRYDFGQLAYVAAHAENSVGDYELAVGIRRGGQLCFKVRHVAVGVSYKLGVAESAAVINAGMVFAVAENYVVASRYAGNNAEIALKARAESDGILLAQKVGKLAFERNMNIHGAVEKTAAAASRAVFVKRSFPRLRHLGVGGQPEIVVGAQHYYLSPAHLNGGVLSACKAVEIGVYSRRFGFVRNGNALAFFKNIQFLLSLD